MLLVLMKLLLAPIVVGAASLMARRLGPRRGGAFIGLPTTSLPFLLVVWMGSGQAAALHAGVGSLSGQLVCAMFCIVYARTGPRSGPLVSMLLALGVATAIGFSTLGVHDHALVAAIVVLAAVLGIATWPPQPTLPDAGASRRFDIPLRMLMSCLVVTVMSSLVPHVGASLAGAVSSLPTILMVMCPSVHSSQGPAHAVALARGTLGSIPGTAVFLAITLSLAPVIGLAGALLAGVASLPLSTALVGRLGTAAHGLRSRLLPVAPHSSRVG